MYVIVLNYTKPLFEVDRLLAEHRQYLSRHYALGNFLLSGRTEPRTGGVILAKAAPRQEMERIVSEDPFHREGIAQYTILEFLPTLTAPEFAHLKAG